MAVDAGDIVWRITGDVDGLEQAMAKAKANIGQNLSQLSRTAGVAMTAMGATITGALTAGAMAAIDFESDFAGIIKTVDATDEELAKMREGIREMAKEIPVTVGELAKIGETAGQLGVEKGRVLEFVRVIADLGVSSNLAGEEGATMLARFANITQMPQDQFSNLASAIVALGNAGASTEAEIAAMALRLAGAGEQAGLSEGDILGIANALSSIGIEAEAGGSAFSKVIADMASSAASGGEQLDKLAYVAGVSAEEFATAFRERPAEAITMFIGGLQRMKGEGADLFAVLDELGYSEIRMRDALLRSSSAGDLLAQSIKTGNDAFRENTALTNEASRRYETTASQLTILKNNVYDLAITVGDALLPRINELVDLLRPVLDHVAAWTKANPELTQSIVLAAGAVGAFMTVFGPFLIVLPGAIDLMYALGGVFLYVTGTLTPATVATTAFDAATVGAGVAATGAAAGVAAMSAAVASTGAAAAVAAPLLLAFDANATIIAGATAAWAGSATALVPVGAAWTVAGAEMAATGEVIDVVATSLGATTAATTVAGGGFLALVAPIAAVVAVLAAVAGAMFLFWDEISTSVMSAVDPIIGYFTNYWAQMVEIFWTGVEILGQIMSIFWDGIKIVLHLIATFIGEFAKDWGKEFDRLNEITGDKSASILDYVQLFADMLLDLWTVIASYFHEAAGWIDEHWGTIAAVMDIGVTLFLKPLFYMLETMAYIWGEVSWLFEQIKGAWDWIMGSGAAGQVNLNGNFQGPYADGGTVPRSGWALVGEQGPELVQLPGGSRVHSNEDSAGMMGGVNLTLNFGRDSVRSDDDISRIEQALATSLQTQLRAVGAYGL